MGAAVDYVMVPVPEEHAESVMNYMRWSLGRVPEVPFDEGTVQRLFDEADDPLRLLLRLLAVATTNDEEITVAQVAQGMDLPEREVVGMTLELNERIQLMGGGPTVLLLLKQVSGDAGIWSTKGIAMSPTIARLLMLADQATEATSP